MPSVDLVADLQMSGLSVRPPTKSMQRDPASMLSPLQTEFPYPEPGPASPKDARGNSESTLCESESAPPQASHSIGAENATVHRPSLSAAKYATEISKPVAQRPTIPAAQRKSTGGRQSVGHKLGKAASAPHNNDGSEANGIANGSDCFVSDSSSTSDSDSDGQYARVGAAELNQVRHRPRRQPSSSGSNRDFRSGQFSGGNDQFQTRGKVSRKDGRLHISINETANSGYLAKALGTTLRRHLHPQRNHQEEAKHIHSREPEKRGSKPRIPVLNIVIMVIGSRGDIQPFLKIGKILKERYGHRVRIATHPAFKKFVETDIGLEFFSVGGDPSELMSFMVKNPGLIPSMETVKAGEIGKKRETMYEMFEGFWRACINATDDEKDVANLKMMGNRVSPVSFWSVSSRLILRYSILSLLMPLLQILHLLHISTAPRG